MIYYSNVEPTQPHLTFIGRWTPFHKGHISIIETKRKEHPDLPVLIQIRSTDYDDYKPLARAEVIKVWMEENGVAGTIIIIPDVQGVYWGRGVGYKLEQVNVDKNIQEISATKIRKGINGEGGNWEENLASKNSAGMLTKKTAKIIEDGMVVWLTGCPSAGKTTISNALYATIKDRFPFLKVQQLDGDVMRDTPLARNAGFSPQERAVHIRKMGQLARMFADHGILVLAAFVSPDAGVRDEVREMIGEDRFVEVYVKANKKTRVKRDVKGLYAKAKAGEIENLTGFDAPYEAPVDAVVCDTDKFQVDENVEQVFGEIFT